VKGDDDGDKERTSALLAVRSLRSVDTRPAYRLLPSPHDASLTSLPLTLAVPSHISLQLSSTCNQSSLRYTRILKDTMVGLDALTQAIYHEKQQPGVMLCAQHALNAILRMCTFIHRSSVAYDVIFTVRGKLCEINVTFNIYLHADFESLQFTAPDLSVIARQLDEEELVHNPERGQTSENMDDTGFFSSQVVTRALDPFGLTYVAVLG
jgi:hypothetical protein